MSCEQYFGGCEGGASHSKLVIVDKNGKVLSQVVGEGTNQWLIGLDECINRIFTLLCQAKVEAGLSKDQPLQCLGLSLSGADSLENQQNISTEFLAKHPNASLSCYTCNDTLAPLVTATDGGGVVLIAGTGSNCLLSNPSGATHSCGGWGHIIGDYGGAGWIVLETLKTIYEDNDGFNRSPYDVTFLKKAMYKYFKLKDLYDILPYIYPADGKLDKEFLAKFCVTGIVKGAENNDKLSQHILTHAGEVLGKHVKALIPKMDVELFQNQNEGLKIICIGSVWKSWMYLKDGFLKGITPQTDEEKQLKCISLVKLKPGANASVGAAAWAAKCAGGSRVEINYSEMSEMFFTRHF